MSTPRRPEPRSMGTPTIPISLALAGRLLTCCIVIKAAAGLAAEIAGGNHLTQERRRGEARFLELIEQNVGDEERRIEADVVEQGEWAHRVAGAERHPDVDVLSR